MKKLVAVIIILLVTIVSVTFIRLHQDPIRVDYCEECHAGIEKISDTHELPCTECHGGDSAAQDADIAHLGMYGGKNPSAPEVWNLTCAKCHEEQVKTVSNTLMLTNTGIIKNTQLAWGEEFNDRHATMPMETYDADGNMVELKDVDNLTSMAGRLYRQFCAACHVGSPLDSGYKSHHSSGCASCHFKYNEAGVYLGGDTQMQRKRSYPETHAMVALPENTVCEGCHDRSGRIALSYQGLYDGNNALVPTKYGEPGPVILSGVRNARHMKPDIHYFYGMDCIDCHTQTELMGDGYAYENMYNQLEVSCETCHGDGKNLPVSAPRSRENEANLKTRAAYRSVIPEHMEVVLTDKGRPMSNAVKDGGGYWLLRKRKVTPLLMKTVTDTPEHNVKGHERMECVSCHSRVVIQCYGCHTKYDEREQQYDYIKKEIVDGRFSETEDLRTFYPFPLAINQRGKISPMTPGCQTFFTYVDSEGKTVKSEEVPDFRGKKNLKFAPFFGHNVGDKAIGCNECHSNPFFYGYGDGLFSADNGTLTSPMTCDECGDPLNSLYSIKDGKQNITADIVRENSRIFNSQEIERIINANRCIVCHDTAKGGYYNKEVDYEKVLSDAVHAPLLR